METRLGQLHNWMDQSLELQARAGDTCVRVLFEIGVQGGWEGGNGSWAAAEWDESELGAAGESG